MWSGYARLVGNPTLILENTCRQTNSVSGHYLWSVAIFRFIFLFFSLIEVDNGIKAYHTARDLFQGGNWEQWMFHFRDCAVVNEWDSQLLKFLRVHLTGQAQAVFHRLPDSAKNSFDDAVKALEAHFEPEGKRELYLAEFSTRNKRPVESWGRLQFTSTNGNAHFARDLGVVSRDCHVAPRDWGWCPCVTMAALLMF